MGTRTALRRWHYWLPALLVAAGMGYVAYRAMRPPWKDTEAWDKYEQIRVGMTREELEAVLGQPSEDRETGGLLATPFAFGGRRAEVVSLNYTREWHSLAWSIGEDRIEVHVKKSLETGDRRNYWKTAVIGKSAVIRGHEFSDPANEPNWWDRWRARLGW
jgi:hypothetical protein